MTVTGPVFKDVPVPAGQGGVAEKEEKDWTDYLGSALEIGLGIGGAVAGGFAGSGNPAAILGGYGMGSGLGRTIGGMISPFKEDAPDVRGGMADFTRGAFVGGKPIYEGIKGDMAKEKTGSSMRTSPHKPQSSYMTPRETDMLSEEYKFGGKFGKLGENPFQLHL